MKKVIYKIYLVLFVFLTGCFLFLSGCDDDPVPSIYDDIPGGTGQTPVINSVNPPSEAIAGVTEITISGEHFSTNPEFNLVFFNGTRAAVTSAATTQLIVKAPNLIADSVEIRIGVVGASSYSSKISYKLLPAIQELFAFTDLLLPYGLTSDSQENIFVSISAQGVKKINPSGDLTDFAPRGAETFFNSMKMGPSNTIYVSRRVSGIFELKENLAPATFVASANGIGNVADLDFDQNGNIWASGSGTSVYRVTLDKNVKAFVFGFPTTAIRIFENHLYVSGIENNEHKIWRLPIISSDSLGQRELYFNLTSEVGANIRINAITFALDGDLVVGTDKATNSIIIVHPDKSFNELYPGIIQTPVYSFTWGIGNFLYYTHEAQTVYKINMQKPGAPYFGRNL